MQNARCRIWPDSEAGVEIQGNTGRSILVDSPRTDGIYLLDEPTADAVSVATEEVKARLTTLLIDTRSGENPRPLVTKDMIEQAESKEGLRPSQRADRLLRFLASVSSAIGQAIDPKNIHPQMLAWSESVNLEETSFLTSYLEKAGWIEDSETGMVVQVDGYNRVEKVSSQTDLQQVFVAMWFDDEMEDVYENGIASGIRDAGYMPLRIDRKQDVDYIDDEIIAQINRSRFLVADFTYGETGPRGGVYYEAGHANGRGMTVIFSCRDDLKDKIHFDTRQRYHIFWRSAAELRDKLTTRIIAMVGLGPAGE